MTIIRFARQILATTALAVGVAVGLAATAGAQPDTDEDFLQCVVDHQDTDGIGVCCVFYGGDYDEPNDACFYDFATIDEVQVLPTTPVKPSRMLPRLPITAADSVLVR